MKKQLGVGSVRLALTAVLFIVLGLQVQGPTLAHHKGVYGNVGFHWLAHEDGDPIPGGGFRYFTNLGQYNPPGVRLYVNSSATCPSYPGDPAGFDHYDEENAFGRIEVSTREKPDFVWQGGIEMIHYADNSGYCRVILLDSTDIAIRYLNGTEWCRTHTCTKVRGKYDPLTGAGGHNHDAFAPAEYCQLVHDFAPCGYHWSTVEINKVKWDTKTNLWHQRLIMHELGHSLGLFDYCDVDSIMNNGDGTCNNGKWTDLMEFLAVDRAALMDIYPGWPYPQEVN